MSLIKAPGEAFYPTVNWGAAGLVGTLSVGIRNVVTGAYLVALTTVGIVEDLAENYVQRAGLVAPSIAGTFYEVVWDDTVDFVTEDLTVSYSAATPGTPSPGDLFTVQDLKNHLRSIKATDPSKDDELQMLVTSVSDAAAQYTNHRWAQETAVSKTFRFDDSDGGFLDLNPYDLRAVPTSVLIDTDISPVTLDTSQWRVEPRNKPHGVYTHLDLWLGVGARNTNFWADATPGWAGREVQVVGNWGWPSIPSSLRLSAIAYAAELFTNPTGAAALSKADSSKDFAPRAGTFTVPDAYLALWAPFRRIEF